MSDKIKLTIDVKKLVKELEDMGRDVDRALTPAVMAGGLVIRDAARILIAHSPATGHVYSYGNVEHQASAPGEPPATDTGNLVAGMAVEKGDRSPTVVQANVGAAAEYDEALEFGTSKMRPRPHWRPAIDQNQGAISAAVETQLRKAMP